jgi:hypothetical protein
VAEVRGLAPASIHGGMLATFADEPTGGPLRAEVHLVHRSPRLLSNACVITDSQERVLARTTASYMLQPCGAGAYA